ncbi:MAG: lysylphosphatidylglycerol synthase transmembrane domain-containing protein [Anaerolineae bacterium]
MKLGWKFWLGVLISVACFSWALRGLSLGQVWQEIGSANYWWLIPAVAVYFLAVAARTWRWHYMLRPMGHVPLKQLFPVVVIGYMGNNIYPARAGEFIRSYVLRRNTGIEMSASLATVLVERVFDGLVMLLFVFVAVPFVVLPSWLNFTVIIATVVFAAALAVLVAAAVRPALFLRIYHAIAGRVLPERMRAQAAGLVGRFMFGLTSLSRPRDVLMIFVTSTIIWLTETAKYWVLMHGFPFTVSYLTLMLMTAVVNLATTIPSAPAYAGTFDAPGIKILAASGVAESVSAGYTLVLHAALIVPITLLGFYYMWRQSVKWSDFEKATTANGEGAGAVSGGAEPRPAPDPS